jgi:hypothetical protein
MSITVLGTIADGVGEAAHSTLVVGIRQSCHSEL